MKRITLDEYFKNFPAFSPFRRSNSSGKLPNFLKNNPFDKKYKKSIKKQKKDNSQSTKNINSQSLKKTANRSNSLSNPQDKTTIDSSRTKSKTHRIPNKNSKNTVLVNKGLIRCASASNINIKKIKTKNTKSFLSSLSYEMDSDTDYTNSNLKSLQQMIEGVLLVEKEVYEKEINEKTEKKEELSNNVNDIKKYIRNYQVNKQKYTWENCKLVRLINHLKESNNRYMDRNQKINQVVEDIKSIQEELSVIKQNTKEAKEMVKKEKEKLASVNKSVQTMNKNISDITKEKEVLIPCIFLFQKHIKAVKAKIQNTVHYDSNFMLNMAEITQKSQRSTLTKK